MPELPEVEVTRRHLAPRITGRRITGVQVREPRLRWPVTREVQGLAGRTIRAVRRRAKYLLLDCGDGHLIVHLGMSGSLRLVAPGTPPEKHDHVDIALGDRVLRLRDPRRFGAVLWTTAPPLQHKLLAHLGLEPLTRALSAARLHALSRAHRAAVKLFLMDARRIVGVGNIYASESLFRAGINPRTPANRVPAAKYARLARAIQHTLRAAIRAGGSSLRDFAVNGRSGYFQNRYGVYAREGKPCRRCRAPVKRIVQGQRSTFFCPRCQS